MPGPRIGASFVALLEILIGSTARLENPWRRRATGRGLDDTEDARGHRDQQLDNTALPVASGDPLMPGPREPPRGEPSKTSNGVRRRRAASRARPRAD